MRDNHLTMLLIESNDTCRQILLNQIMHSFPEAEIHATATPHEAIQLLQKKEHDIVICDALLARDQKIDFASHMCSEGDPLVIIITGDTEVEIDSFPAPTRSDCIKYVAYKPLDLHDLMRMIADAADSVALRKAKRRDG